MRRDFYVYEHWRPDTGLPFYVGKGRGKRANEMTARTKHHKNIQQKLTRLGFVIEVHKIFTGLDEEMAFMLERSQISYWRAHSVALINKTDGGEGAAGFCWSAEQKLASRRAAVERWRDPIYIENFRRGHKAALSKPGANQGSFSEERRLQISVRAKNFWDNPENKSRVCEKLRQLGISEKTKAGMASPIVKAKLSASAKLAWENPTIRANNILSFNRPELKETQAKAMADRWRDPVFREAALAQSVRAARATTLKELYKDPVLREKISLAVKEARAAPEARAAMSAAAKKAFADPAVKERHRKALKAAWARRKAAEAAHTRTSP